VTASVHARAIVIAGSLAALALALGFVTLAMNQTASQAAPRTILPLKARHHVAGAATTVRKTAAKPTVKAKKKVVVKPSPFLVAALKAGLPRSIAVALAKRRVVVVELWAAADPVARLSLGEARAGAALAGAAFVGINVDTDAGGVGVLATVLGKIPEAPALLVYTRPATLSITLPGFNDRTAVQQAVTTATTAKSSTSSLQSGSGTAQTTTTTPGSD
jgi:hypothetical protein